MADKLLDVNGLTVSVEEKEILHDINLSINKGETHVLMGPNGAGKTTLIRAILNDIPHEGSIDFRDTENGHMRRMKIGYVPQS